MSFFHSNKSIPTFWCSNSGKGDGIISLVFCARTTPKKKKTRLFRWLLYGRDFLWSTCPLEVLLLSTLSANHVLCRTYFNVVVRTLSTPWTFHLFGLTTYLTSVRYILSWSPSHVHRVNWDFPYFIVAPSKTKTVSCELFMTVGLLSQLYPEWDQHSTVAGLTIYYRECMLPVCLKSIHHVSLHSHNVHPVYTHHWWMMLLIVPLLGALG